MAGENMDELYGALKTAYEKGDTESAKKLGAYIKDVEKKHDVESASGRVESLDEELGAYSSRELEQGAMQAFHMRDPKQLAAGETTAAMAGGAVAGGVANSLLPKALELGSKLVPGPLGKVAGEVGKTMARTPLNVRALGGTLGGAAMGAWDSFSDALGLPTAVKFGGGLAASGVGESLGVLAAKEVRNLAYIAGNAATGNLSGAARAFGQLKAPNKEGNLESAKLMQKELFENKIPDFENNLVSSEARLAAQKQLRAQDPSLPGYDKDIRPASQLYREKLDAELVPKLQEGKLFSKSPEAQRFADYLAGQVKLQYVSKEEATGLLKGLSTDADKKLQAAYPKRVDDYIREFGKPAERGGQTGYAAVTSGKELEVRAKLQEAYNGYLQRIGLGPLEEKTRQAYTVEKLAEVKDNLPRYLRGNVPKKELDSMVMNLSKDPQAVKLLQGGMEKHLANVEAKDVMEEFTRLQDSLETSGLVTPRDLAQLRKNAKVVQSVAEKGLQMKLAERFRQKLLVTMSQAGGVEAGKAGAEAADGMRGQRGQ